MAGAHAGNMFKGLDTDQGTRLGTSGPRDIFPGLHAHPAIEEVEMLLGEGKAMLSYEQAVACTVHT
jgi:hypothetical protein